MRRWISLLFALCVLLGVCVQSPASAEGQSPNTQNAARRVSVPIEGEAVRPRVLVAYFSATGVTRSLAESAAEVLKADLVEIVPRSPYTADDLDYGDASSRSSREQGDADARPAISGRVENMEDYDVVLLGYPIWHGQAPRILCTFLESYDLTGKKIVPFCTSQSSGIGSSDANLHAFAERADWTPGKRFAGDASQLEVEEWIKGLDLPVEDESAAQK